jgi:glycosyltransferase involved in cell wall biosynthesis
MGILIFSVLIIATVYYVNILFLIFGFSMVKSFYFFNTTPKTGFTIIVPFRNEAANLPKLLQSLNLLEYPIDLFEVILVNDESSEKFHLEVSVSDSKFKIKLMDNIRLTNSPKKDAINTAMAKTKFDWVITTDADCEVPPTWLWVFDNYIQEHQPKMIAAGVSYKTKSNFLEHFQQLDIMSLQGTTIGSFGIDSAFMCNGANFCYKLDFFYALNGFDGNESIASGDDVFLLQKGIQKEPEHVHFLKSKLAVVETTPESTWKALFFQRVRWASKTKNYKTVYPKQLGMTVFLMNLIWILVVGSWLLEKINGIFFISFITSKFVVDLTLIYKTSRLFKKHLKYILLSSIVYPFFTIAVVVYSFFGNYTWKGRQFKG